MKEVKSQEVERVVRKYLINNGYDVSQTKKCGETGADIVAIKGKIKLFIEEIGYNTKPPIKSREFFESFFRIISRDENNKNHKLIIALPIKFLNGMEQRKLVYGIAWDKIAKVFPNLWIWYVNTKTNEIKKFPWENPF